MEMEMSALRMRLAGAMAAAFLGSTAEAAVITGLYNTGVDNSGVALVGGDGVADLHYQTLASTVPDAVGRPPVTYRHPNYAPDDADSRWISYTAVFPPGPSTTTYRLTFDLTGLDPATALITGRFGADNFVSLYLNGDDTGQFGIEQFPVLKAFTVASGFRAGVNHLDFVITDSGPPGAFRVDDLAGTADLAAPPVAGVPEPSAWALMLAGFFGAGAVLRRGRRGRAFA
jgi:hypothetical protein